VKVFELSGETIAFLLELIENRGEIGHLGIVTKGPLMQAYQRGATRHNIGKSLTLGIGSSRRGWAAEVYEFQHSP
jgi:hypothetical protein